MCKVVVYVVTDVMLAIRLCIAYLKFITNFYVERESKTPYPLTSSTPLSASISLSSRDSIVTPTPAVPLGK